MITNGIPYSINSINGKLAGNLTSFSRRQVFMWISKPIGTNVELPDGGAGITADWLIKNWFNKFKSITAAELANPTNFAMIQIAGDGSVLTTNPVVLRKLEFINYSVQSFESGTEIQKHITDSLVSENAAYPQARFNYAPMPEWLFNFFRPKFEISGTDYFAGLRTFPTGKSPEALSSVGLTLPYVDYPNALIDRFVGSSFNVEGACIIPVSANAAGTFIAEDGDEMYYQQYPVVCRAEFVY